MSKYFSNNSDFSHYNLTDDNTTDVTKMAMPKNTNISEPLSENKRDALTQSTEKLYSRTNPTTENEHIAAVHEDIQEVNNIIDRYTEEAKTTIKNQFDKFGPAELMEKMNQIMFMLMSINDRLVAVESQLKNENQPNRKERIISDPREIMAFEKQLESNPKIVSDTDKITTQNSDISFAEASKLMEDVKGGKHISIPNENYIDGGVNLEELFPDLDDDAYQAAYNAIQKKSKTDGTKPSQIPPGSMRGITGF